MAVRTARWATRLGAVLRPIATVVGGTFAIHRLSARIEAPGSSATYLEAMEQALELPDPVPAAVARTLALGLVGAVLGLVVGAVAAVVWHRRFDHDHPVRRGGPIGACALGLFVPGLVWLPVERLVDPGLGAEPPSLAAGGVGPLLLWGLVIGLAVAPTVAATLGPRRPWGPAGQIDGTVPLGLLVTRSSGRRWHLGLPALPFGLTLATTEVVSGNEGLFDRFHRSAISGDPELLVALALPVVVIAAGLVAAAEIAPALVDQRPRPIPPGATGPGRRRGHDLAVALYLSETVTTEEADAIIRRLNADELVGQGGRFWTVEEERERIVDLLSEDLMRGVDADAIPAQPMIEVRFGEGRLDEARFAAMNELTNELAQLPAVEEVSFEADHVGVIFAIGDLVTVAGLLVCAIALYVALFFIALLVRLGIDARQDAIAMERALGATERYLYAPMTVAGLLVGLLGGGVAVVVAVLIDGRLAALAETAPTFGIDLGLVNAGLILWCIGGGVILAVAGTWFSVRRDQLRHENS